MKHSHAHIEFFVGKINQMVSLMGKDRKRGTRHLAAFVVYRLNGIEADDLSRLFGMNYRQFGQGLTWYSRQMKYSNELFLQQYNKMLILYIKEVSEYLRLNQIYNLKKVA